MLIWLTLILFSAVGVECMYLTDSNVVELTMSNFNAHVINNDSIWIVEFYAPWCGHCQKLKSEYEKTATALKGIIKVGAVNADEYKSLGTKYSVQGFPTIKIFGDDKSKPDDYNGPRTAAALVDAALNAANQKAHAKLSNGKFTESKSRKSQDSKDVVELADSTFDRLVLESEDMWLVEFYAPWCGYCKKLAPQWASAASELKGKVKLGALDATVHTLKSTKYDVRGYPTIKYFPPGKKNFETVAEYDGGRTTNDIVTWALEKLSENVPAPKLVHVINEDSFKEACDNAPLCIISVLPHILDCQSNCRNEYLKILSNLGEKYKQKMWGWVWFEANAQSHIEQTLEIGGFGYPALAAVNFKKMKYSPLKGSFSYEGINEFLRNLSYGRGSTASLKTNGVPKIYNTKAWDGKDMEPLEEEDIDLSDVELDEKIEL